MIRPAGRLLLGAAGAAATGLAVLVAVLAWVLSAGPLSLGFLSPYVEDILQKTESEVHVEFDDVVLTWAGWKRTLDVRIVGVRIFSEDGAPVASLPAVSVALSGRALLRGTVAPTSLDMFGVEARLVRRPDGRVDFGLQGEDTGVSGIAEQLLAELLKPPDPTRTMGYLRRVSVLDADITVDDQVSERTWHAPRADVVLVRDGEGIGGTAEVDVALGDEVVHLLAEAAYSGAERTTRLNIHFTDVETARLQGAGALFRHLKALRTGVSGRVGLTVDLAGTLSDLSFEARAGPGRLDLPELYESPQRIAALDVRGRLDEGFDVLRLEAATVDFGGPVATASGELWLSEERPGARLEGVLEGMTIAALKRLWPLNVARGARAWSMGHLHEGRMTDVTYRIDAPPEALAKETLPDKAFVLDYAFEGISLSYYDPLPSITAGKGRARISAGRFDLALAEARLAGLEIRDGTLTISGLNEQDQRARVTAVARGTVKQTMMLLDHEPLGYSRALDLDPAVLGGLSATRLQFNFPVRNDLRAAEIEFSAAANLSDAAIPNLHANYGLTKGTLGLQVDGSGVVLGGLAELNGVPVRVAWQRRFGAPRDFRSRFALSGLFDDAERRALFVPTGDYVRGPIAVNLEILTSDGGDLRTAVDIGLKGARVRVPVLHWSKPAQAPGSLRLAFKETEAGEMSVDSFTLAAADLAAAGKAVFDAEWGLRRIDLHRLTFGTDPGTDIAASLRRDDGGAFSLVVEGERLDLRPYLEGLGDDEDETTAPVALSARLARVIVDDEREFSDVSATASYDGARWHMLDMAGTLNRDAPLELSLSPRDGHRVLKVTSSDASSVARALDIFKSSEGGTLAATAVIRDDLPGRPIEGEVIVDDFRVVRAPVLTRILTVGSVTGILDLMNGDGIGFARLVAPFRMADSTVTLDEARAYGRALGITITGTIDREAETADLKGTIVPSYTINSILGNIPVLGDILVGKEGEGVFALTYTVKGATDDPRIAVNPLSALAPGFLRRMLFLGEGDGLPEREEGEGPK